jgi:NCS1 family nucleobase:cation symporter-1
MEAPAVTTLEPSARVRVEAGIHELVEEIRSPYINHDLAPARLKERKWATKDIAALWISMCACVPTYMLASSLIAEGMNWWQAVLTIFLGNTIVLVPMVLERPRGHEVRHPLPGLLPRVLRHARRQRPAVLRALVACGWFGIQSWIGGWAIYKILAVYMARAGASSLPIQIGASISASTAPSSSASSSSGA